MSTAYSHVDIEGSTLGAGQPEYQRVADDLRQQIADGRLKAGHPIPSTKKLSELYSVSPIVVRRAVGDLTNEGLLYGEKGVGVFVNEGGPTKAARGASVAQALSGIDALQKQIDDMRAANEIALESLSRDLTVLRRQVVELKERPPAQE
ncbi:GntR family transcriptional regulator [Streptomyces aureoversilis]|uniref:GntR family transcriptional regulator n=1 Tax=Streptomyces aureoversilis TaxID=67277 RepID=A0ABW0A5P5_9ACTN